ncbi:36.4 kDa proline-rich protein [Amborella trichopoda]|uniref:Bifunctional inhibitor/plant lipid transfer protein/seed storage helical domain-containing protein n=1 Tax=Amborella trichopoda TaxID=13333 RepID=U5D0P0_AMBTC|nr:36.4 kDa proline-rich protein [Amborella trichopoda]ERN14957.1 hypothetical protein AMTR_s00032p00211090 [Amborella trichopoda]|eukprot:XP_020528582.1 36.4 kDa proline-rich protein [Amborella trichopoda]
MEKGGVIAFLLLLIQLGAILPSLSCPSCPPSYKPPYVPKLPPKRPPKVFPPPYVMPKPPPKVETPCPPPPRPPPTETPCPPPPPKTPQACPIDTLKLAACVDLLGGVAHAVIGEEVKKGCCPLVQGVADLDAALCLCTTIRAKALNLNVVLPIALQVLIGCGKSVPPGFQCP